MSGEGPRLVAKEEGRVGGVGKLGVDGAGAVLLMRGGGGPAGGEGESLRGGGTGRGCSASDLTGGARSGPARSDGFTPNDPRLGTRKILAYKRKYF